MVIAAVGKAMVVLVTVTVGTMGTKVRVTKSLMRLMETAKITVNQTTLIPISASLALAHMQ
ncbi:hypothetical protein D3C80_1704790 [compost metagenome]